MTTDALLEALREAAQQTPGGNGLRVDELCEHLAMGEQSVRRLLSRAMAAGTVRRTTRVIEQINGYYRRVPAYEAVP